MARATPTSTHAPPAPEPADTKERILDAAEHLFADRGFEATSLRSVTREAGVNLAAVNYHFGSKEQLIEAVFRRRVEPLNAERLSRLDRLQAESGPAAPTVEQIVRAFLAPALRLKIGPDHGSSIVRVLGHCFNQPNAELRHSLMLRFAEVFERYSKALHRALPQLNETDLVWRFLFMVGSMAYTMSMADDLGTMSRGVCDPDDIDSMLDRLVRFVSAGLKAEASGRTP